MDKEQLKADAANVDKQITGAAAAFNAPKWVLYAVGVLALVGAVNLALRSGHRRRLAGIAQERADRKADRQTNRPTAGSPTDLLASNATSITVNPDSSLVKARQAKTAIQANRLDNLLTLYRVNPTIGVTNAARTLNMSRQTVYSYLERLETEGRIRRNGHGVEIIKG